MTNKELLKQIINNLRDERKQTIKSDELSEEALYYLQEGYREGLASAAMLVADELDAIESDEPYGDTSHSECEEIWWHTHNDDAGDIGSEERLK